MSLIPGFHRMIRRIAGTLAVPPVEEVLLPVREREEGKQDEFGFILLRDGSIGPFYTSLDESLVSLRTLLSERAGYRGADATGLALSLGDSRPHINALALGAVNAISRHLMRRAGFDPVSCEVAAELTEPSGVIGMVGYFGSLVEGYLAEGLGVVLVEKNPGRVPAGLEITLSTDPASLEGCDYVVCTASTLINNTLEEVLASASGARVVHLMGPSASCLPDPLFTAGVDLVGGTLIDDPECLRRAVLSGASWGGCGHKYQLSRACYPGLNALLAAARRS